MGSGGARWSINSTLRLPYGRGTVSCFSLVLCHFLNALVDTHRSDGHIRLWGSGTESLAAWFMSEKSTLIVINTSPCRSELLHTHVIKSYATYWEKCHLYMWLFLAYDQRTLQKILFFLEKHPILASFLFFADNCNTIWMSQTALDANPGHGYRGGCEYLLKLDLHRTLCACSPVCLCLCMCGLHRQCETWSACAHICVCTHLLCAQCHVCVCQSKGCTLVENCLFVRVCF